ncbi:MAG: carboxypeptidase-like regulatory domain-containing protein [Cyclobacteriaceae bacterium]|nr:carboxypeptidase-like regulatory domain-containing protein [Cyclobacteriaceae bacterium]
MRALVVILFFCSLVCQYAQAQVNSITGVVRDSLSHESLPYVNVFFANTSIGTSTNSEGEFSISGFPPGKYDLVISFVGYKTQQYSFDFSGSAFKLDVALAQSLVQLSEILVKADTMHWKQNFLTFKENFIGTTANAAKVAISNSKDIHLYFDAKDKVLVAHARKDLVIENKALGYQVYYQLVDFTLDYRNNRMQYLGIPRFEQMKATHNLQAKKWETERRRAYEGSFVHLIQTIYQQKLESSKFQLFELHEVMNPKRPPQKFLDEKIKLWRDANFQSTNNSKEKTVVRISGNGVVSGSGLGDSLAYYLNLRSLPEKIDSIGREIKSASDLLKPGTSNIIQFKGRLKVLYKEREEALYAMGQRRPPQRFQESVVHFTDDELKIYPNGYYEDVRSLFMQGYLGWSEKIAEMLPTDYKYEVK